VERHGGALQFCARDLQRDRGVLRAAGRSLVLADETLVRELAGMWRSVKLVLRKSDEPQLQRATTVFTEQNLSRMVFRYLYPDLARYAESRIQYPQHEFCW
jgi:hypothetical protein